VHDGEIRNVIWAPALMPVLPTLSDAPIAVLRRSLKYKQLAIRSMLRLTIGGVFGIVLAVAGVGVWALVLQALAQRITELVGIAVLGILPPRGRTNGRVSWSSPPSLRSRSLAL
jgi:O-antigen/teichoic acid export membrane protein